MNSSSPHKPTDWSALLEQWNKNRHLSWRSYSDWINLNWLQAWWPESPVGKVLKTDLFDEATSTGLMPWLFHHSRFSVGMDISEITVRDARREFPKSTVLGGDVRSLPFADHSFDLVFSLSTLDHFPSTGEIDLALQEFHRVLLPGGKLLMTLDNLSNPIVRLRNLLPSPVLIRGGVLPYPTGKTCTPRALFSKLQNAGFSVGRSTAILHCPRALAVALLPRLRSENRQLVLEWLKKFEYLANYSTRYFTGYYIGVEGTKNQ
jgi:SAM-dependent methyltransferase